MEINRNKLKFIEIDCQKKIATIKLPFSKNLNKFQLVSMNFYLYPLVFIFSFSFMGCDYIYGLLDKEGAEEKKLVGDVVPFESNPTVEEIQKLLKIYGYDPGKIDGMMGLRTRDAIVKFQKDNQLPETRKVDQETWGKLSYFKDIQLVVNNELNVRVVQMALSNAGFNPGPIDGAMGEKTQQAIKEFQKANQLKVDGKIGYKTLSILATYLPQTNLDVPENL